jgi:transmembrane sensor
MNEKMKILSLLRKLRGNSIKPDDLALLKEQFKSKEPNLEVIKAMGFLWETSEDDSQEFNANKNYALLAKQLNISEQEPNLKEVKKILAFKYSIFLKYAAVFVIAFGLSWLISSFFNKENLISDNKFVTIQVPNGSKSKVELPDGSMVTLNAGSYIKYPTTFGSETRNVFFEGEAYFDIRKDKRKPFIVNTSNIKIKVLGTTFNVKSYPNDKKVETTLITGSVEIISKNPKNNEQEHTFLKPNQKANIFKDVCEIEATNVKLIENKQIKPNETKQVELEKDVNTNLYTGWTDNQLIFDNEKFQDLIVKMERWYGVTIRLHSPELKNARFSGRFEQETIQQSLTALTFIAPLYYDINKNVVDIYKKSNSKKN